MSTNSNEAELDFYDFDPLYESLTNAPFEVPTFDDPPLTDIKVKLQDATVALLLTSGPYYPDQPRLGETNDLSFRLLPRERSLDEILFAHMTPIRAFALTDPNVAYPLDRMLELESNGTIGRLADNAISMVGSVDQFEQLATETAPRIVAELEAMKVDLLLVLPFCPRCHKSAAILARAIEQRGIPTASIATLRNVALKVKPPRASFLDFPLGCNAGKPHAAAQQRSILQSALTYATEASHSEWALNRLPYAWAEDGSREWETLVEDIYRLDNRIRGTMTSHRSAHSGEAPIIGREKEFTIQCAC